MTNRVSRYHLYSKWIEPFGTSFVNGLTGFCYWKDPFRSQKLLQGDLPKNTARNLHHPFPLLRLYFPYSSLSTHFVPKFICLCIILLKKADLVKHYFHFF